MTHEESYDILLTVKRYVNTETVSLLLSICHNRNRYTRLHVVSKKMRCKPVLVFKSNDKMLLDT